MVLANHATRLLVILRDQSAMQASTQAFTKSLICRNPQIIKSLISQSLHTPTETNPGKRKKAEDKTKRKRKIAIDSIEVKQTSRIMMHSSHSLC
ncbi:hypothetical protein LWI29_007200 [Acer saccharum]|uniref:Uncharacterized protein n=1 Tax=Acer saccharum TaxID=4024 RepID=A0AA39SAC2_ACESA|nr:hypothetical protein LWI29_007200 [Acer saccharum]